MKFIIFAAIIGLFCIAASATEQGYVAQILTANDGTSNILFKLDNGTYAVNNNPNRYLVISKEAKSLYALLLWASTSHQKVNVELGAANGSNTNAAYLYVQQVGGF